MEQLSAGGLAFSYRRGKLQVLLVCDRFGWWTLPKGHIEWGEGPTEAALRELAEETGYVGQIHNMLPTVLYSFWLENQRVEKFVHYYLIEVIGGHMAVQVEEIRDARWFFPEQVWRLRQYENNRPVIEAGLTLLKRWKGEEDAD